MSELAQVEVFRFNPKEDKAPRYDTYKAPFKDMSVLDVLMHILKHDDPTLSFRYGCDVGHCYGCLMLVNGEPVVACNTVAEAKMKIDPLPKFQVIKDLVVNFNAPK